MLPLSPAMFATLVSGALRLGREAHVAHLTNISRNQDFVMLVTDVTLRAQTPYCEESAKQYRAWIRDWVYQGRYHLPGQRYEGIFATDASGQIMLDEENAPVVPLDKQTMLDDAMAERIAKFEVFQNEHHPETVAQSSILIYYNKIWNQPGENSPWGRFFRHFVDVSFDVLAIQPGLLGLGGNIETFLTALFPKLAEIYDVDNTQGRTAGPKFELLNVFAEAALKTIADHPSLVTTEKRWEPLIKGVLQPLQDEVGKDGFMQLVAERRIYELVGGPMAFAALSTFSENADDFLKGEFVQNGVLGAIARDTLGAFVSTSGEGRIVREVFSEAGALKVYKSALNVARQRPEMFIAGKGRSAGTQASCKLLTGIAMALQNAPAPFGKDDDLGPEIAAIGLEALHDYATLRWRGQAGDDEVAAMGADIASDLLGSILSGIAKAVGSPQAADRNIFADVFTREQATDVFRIMARHAARSPHIVLGKSANPQITAIAEAVALAISHDAGDLLTGDDWRSVITVALDTALKNPGRLFSLEDNASAAESIALKLISQVLETAKVSMQADAPASGKILFGETLSAALRATLSAAGNGALAVIQDTLKDQAKLEDHLSGVAELARRLNALAGSSNPERVISADDWIHIYSFYISNVLERGRAAIDTVDDNQLLLLLKDDIIETVEGAPT